MKFWGGVSSFAAAAFAVYGAITFSTATSPARAQQLSIPHYSAFLDAGVPDAALRETFKFYNANIGQVLRLKADGRYTSVPFKNKRFVGIADYSLASDEKRFYLLDLQTGNVEKFLVSHGTNTGGKWAYRFSNTMNSRQSSLGAFVTGHTYPSKQFDGTAMKLYGAQTSNDRAYERFVVLHPAEYASEEFVQRRIDGQKLSRLGRSFGCFAFAPDITPTLIKKLGGGALIYSYFDAKTAAQAVSYPDYQSVNHEFAMRNPETDNPPLLIEEAFQISGRELRAKKAQLQKSRTSQR